MTRINSSFRTILVPKRSSAKTSLRQARALPGDISDDDNILVVRLRKPSLLLKKGSTEKPNSNVPGEGDSIYVVKQNFRTPSPEPKHSTHAVDKSIKQEVLEHCSTRSGDNVKKRRRNVKDDDDDDDDGDDIRLIKKPCPNDSFSQQPDLSPLFVRSTAVGLTYVKKLPPDCRSIEAAASKGLKLTPYMTIAIDSHDLFHIASILQSNGKVFLRGWHMRRTTSAPQYFTAIPDELVILAASITDTRADPALSRCQVTIDLPLTIQKASCHFTNQQPSQQQQPARESTLTCRLIIIEKLKPCGSRGEFVCKRLTPTECSFLTGPQGSNITKQLTTDLSLLIDWRGPLPVNVDRKLLFSTKKRISADMTHFDRKYTFADICCGGGGTARGAVMAGLEVRYLVDRDENAYETCRRNFKPNARIYQWDVANFCKHAFTYDIQVDILHVSFPCPEFSRAKRGGRIDYEMLTLGKYLRQLIRKIKPRILTMEQVDGIISKDQGVYLQQYIRHITSCGYSARYRVERLDEFGNVHKRRRLSIIASCPGEPLPTLPMPTHGPGLLPYTTIEDVLDHIDEDTISPGMRFHYSKTGAPFDPNRPLKRCVKGNDGGEDNVHYSGARAWNLAEWAAFQGFPQSHKFFGPPSARMKQIVNAVPSVYAEKLFRHLIQHLRASDARLQVEQDRFDQQ